MACLSWSFHAQLFLKRQAKSKVRARLLERIQDPRLQSVAAASELVLEGLREQLGSTDSTLLRKRGYTLQQPLFDAYRNALKSFSDLAPPSLGFHSNPLVLLVLSEGAGFIRHKFVVEPFRGDGEFRWRHL